MDQERADYADPDPATPPRVGFVWRLLLTVGIVAVGGVLWRFKPH